MNDLPLSNLKLPDLKKSGPAIVAILPIFAGLGLTLGQFIPTEQAVIQAKILNSPSIVVAAKTEQKDDEAPDRGTDGGKHKLLEDTQTEDLIIAGVRVKQKGEQTPSGSKRHSFNTQEEKKA